MLATWPFAPLAPFWTLRWNCGPDTSGSAGSRQILCIPRNGRQHGIVAPFVSAQFCIAMSQPSFTPDSYDCLRDRFLGAYRTETNPEAVERGECHGSAELGGNHCGALHKRLVLNAGWPSTVR